MSEETNPRQYKSFPFSILPADIARIERMARANERSTSAQIRTLVMPLVEAWEREQGISLATEKPE